MTSATVTNRTPPSSRARASAAARRSSVAGFNAGAYLPAHPHLVGPALRAARTAVAAGQGETEIDVLPLAEAATAHERMESRDLAGRIVLATR